MESINFEFDIINEYLNQYLPKIEELVEVFKNENNEIFYEKLKNHNHITVKFTFNTSEKRTEFNKLLIDNKIVITLQPRYE
jgi:hypothetical protein